MSIYCIASPHKDESWYDYRLYVNLIEALERQGHQFQAGAENRIYFLGGPLRQHYPKVGQFDPNANNIALIYCHFQKIFQLTHFDHVFVPSNKVRAHFLKRKWKDRIRFKSDKPFETRTALKILRPFSSLQVNENIMPELVCDIAFMGVPRKRPIVESMMQILERHDLKFNIIGPNWAAYPGHAKAKRHCVARSIDYTDFPAFANSAKIHLIDHHDTMKSYGAVSHKYVDLIRAGAFVISDDNPDARDYYGGICYRSVDELETLILTYLNDESARIKQKSKQYELVKRQSTEQAAKQLSACFR